MSKYDYYNRSGRPPSSQGDDGQLRSGGDTASIIRDQDKLVDMISSNIDTQFGLANEMKTEMKIQDSQLNGFEETTDEAMARIQRLKRKVDQTRKEAQLFYLYVCNAVLVLLLVLILVIAGSSGGLMNGSLQCEDDDDDNNNNNNNNNNND